MKPRALRPRVAPKASARTAGLRYASDDRPGIRRLRSGGSFRYRTASGRPLRRRGDLARIRALAIPPAWTEVWISPQANAHLQATGRDARGRKQYRYHPRWRAARDETKFERMIEFGVALPRLRARLARDLRRRGLPREKVLATVVRLLEATLIRVGNEEYARTNRSYGLTTLRDAHVRAGTKSVRFAFLGKSRVRHEVELDDPRLAKIVRRCRDLPGQQLFQYVDEDGARHTVGSADVNAYLQELTGRPFTAKDFRTWAATALAARLLRGAEEPSAAARKRAVLAALDTTAETLGTTRAVCRRCYVHPAVLAAHEEGTLAATLARRIPPALRRRLRHLGKEERRLLAFLWRRVGEGARAGR